MKTAFLTLILLLGATAAQELTRSKRLTAFGKSPPNPSTQPPLVGKGKECKTDQECAHIVYSSCKIDDRDARKRCICNDGSPIKNGQCVNRPRDMVLFRPAPTPQFFPNPAQILASTTTTRKPLFIPQNRIALRETCSNDGECLDGGECKINPNATTSVGQRRKVCLCREGRIELNNQCNGSKRSFDTENVLLAIGIISVLFARRAY